jgi:hypothetical protein
MVKLARTILSERVENINTMSNPSKKPSWLPVVIASLAIISSLIIFDIEKLRYSPAIYIAYFLTPFTPILSLAITRTRDTKARSDIFYDLAKGQKIVSLSVALSIIGFIVALPVMYHIAKVRSQI